MNIGAVLATSQGRRLKLGGVLGKGGEAAIYRVENDGNIAVKIYTDGKAAERRPKLVAMIRDRLSERNPFVAFPLETVTAKGIFTGFTMRKAIGAKLMHQLCSPGDRKAEFPEADFRFMVRVALNFARSVASLNSVGVVIGDINESGVMIDQKGLITVIDSDSFQYRSGGSLFRCRVGKPEYTPPELQNQPLGSVDRTVNHDAFGLAVVIFEILFMGRHPFSGIYRGVGDQPTISNAIQEGRFAYSQDKARTQMEPPPHVPVLADVPMDVALAFQRAFGLVSPVAPTRPTAAEWVLLLDNMEKGIIECKANSAHYYSRAAQSCPWCRFDAGFGSALFISHRPISSSTFDIEYILPKINEIQCPGAAPDLISLMPSIVNLTRSQAAKNLRRQTWGRKAGGLAVAALSIFLMSDQMGWGFLLLIPAAILFFGKTSGAATFTQQCALAESNWKKLVDTWNRDAGTGKFDGKKEELMRTVSAYRALPSVERVLLQDLETKKRDLQMRKHLEAHKLSGASIDGIGDGRKTTLRSFGIETAWEIKAVAVRAVPGFGPKLSENLLDWRLSVERSFKFNPTLPTDPKEIARVRSEVSTRRNTMETQLIKGVRDLETFRAESLAKRRDVTLYQSAYLAFRQAQKDIAFL